MVYSREGRMCTRILNRICFPRIVQTTITKDLPKCCSIWQEFCWVCMSVNHRNTYFGVQTCTNISHSPSEILVESQTAGRCNPNARILQNRTHGRQKCFGRSHSADINRQTQGTSKCCVPWICNKQVLEQTHGEKVKEGNV